MGLFSKLFHRKKKHHIYYTDDYDLSSETIERNHDFIISQLRAINRPGTENVINYLEASGFFIVPASVHHHHRGRGGLAQHSIEVYEEIMSLDLNDVPHESIVIAALLHGIYKADHYKYNDDESLTYVHGRQHGRGRKTLSILKECGFPVTEPERRAIRWQMGGNNAQIHDFDDVAAARQESLWRALVDADRLNSGR